MKYPRLKLVFLIVSLLIISDQCLKFWIKTNMALGDEFHVFGNWFIIHFVENNGMAFGFEFAGEYGKMFLSIFRIIAVIAIGWYLVRLCRKEVPRGFIVSLSLIFAGALGNIIDSAFYGLLFDHSYGQVASFLPENGGYAGFLHGKVVDMFYFPLIVGQYPEWIPYLGGSDFIFFRPVFNIADSSITIGIFSILLFYRNIFDDLSRKNELKTDETAVETEDTHTVKTVGSRAEREDKTISE
jgi:signal peptidase II